MLKIIIFFESMNTRYNLSIWNREGKYFLLVGPFLILTLFSPPVPSIMSTIQQLFMKSAIYKFSLFATYNHNFTKSNDFLLLEALLIILGHLFYSGSLASVLIHLCVSIYCEIIYLDKILF